VPQYTVSGVSVVVVDPTIDLAMHVNETYVLAVTSSVISISATTIWGALHGLESLAQIVTWSNVDGSARNVVSNVPLVVTDAPRFAWRGLLIDTARHYLPESTIMQTIDGIAMVKMNVLHWHLVDAESFPFESASFPELAKQGAYSKKATYPVKNITAIVAHARTRGVIVVPEIDTPGHTAAIVNARPDVMCKCWEYIGNSSHRPVGELIWPAWDNLALDLSANATWPFITQLYQDVMNAFPQSQYVHLGGDEVVGKCWTSSASMRAYMRALNFTVPDTGAAPPKGFNRAFPPDGFLYDTAGVQLAYERDLDEFISTAGRVSVAWEEAFYDDLQGIGEPLSADAIVHVWTNAEMFGLAAKRNRSMLSSFDWYVDRQSPDNTCSHYAFVQTWIDLYNFDPVTAAVAANATRSDAERLILGGELASWGESVDVANNDVRDFTRGVAVAERLWSPAALINDSRAAVARLASWRCKARRAGLMPGDTGPSFCDVPHELSASHWRPSASTDDTGTDTSWVRFALAGLGGAAAGALLFGIILAIVLRVRRTRAAAYSPLPDRETNY
jgi:hexosaminidase